MGHSHGLMTSQCLNGHFPVLIQPVLEAINSFSLDHILWQGIPVLYGASWEGHRSWFVSGSLYSYFQFLFMSSCSFPCVFFKECVEVDPCHPSHDFGNKYKVTSQQPPFHVINLQHLQWFLVGYILQPWQTWRHKNRMPAFLWLSQLVELPRLTATLQSNLLCFWGPISKLATEVSKNNYESGNLGSDSQISTVIWEPQHKYGVLCWQQNFYSWMKACTYLEQELCILIFILLFLWHQIRQ